MTQSHFETHFALPCSFLRHLGYPTQKETRPLAYDMLASRPAVHDLERSCQAASICPTTRVAPSSHRISPEAMNAINYDMRRELFAVLDDLARAPSTGAIVITGEGKAFCASSDLKSAAATQDTSIRRTARTMLPIRVARSRLRPRGHGKSAYLMAPFVNVERNLPRRSMRERTPWFWTWMAAFDGNARESSRSMAIWCDLPHLKAPNGCWSAPQMSTLIRDSSDVTAGDRNPSVAFLVRNMPRGFRCAF